MPSLKPAGRLAVAAVCSALLLAACGGGRPSPQAQPTAKTEPAPAEQPKAQEPQAPAATETTVTPAPERKTARLPKAPPPPPEPVNDDPEQFVGQDRKAIGIALGDPGLVRRDGPAEVWQYRGENCYLDLFLYASKSTLSVRYVDLRGPRSCLADIIRDRKKEQDKEAEAG